MAAVSPDLRPRRAAELYDAAIHLSLRGGTALAALALAGISLPAAAFLWLAWGALNGRGYLLQAAALTAALAARALFAGAASLAGEAALEGGSVGAREALRRALARAPSLVSASGLGALMRWGPVFPSLLAAPCLAARGDVSGLGALGAGGRVARSPALGVGSLHALAFAVVLLNVHGAVAATLLLARSLLGADVTFLARFASPENPGYLCFALALTAVLLEPVTVALGLLLVVDSRVRSDGLDLQAAADRLVTGKRAAAALALAWWLAPHPARAADAGTVRRLDSVVEQVGLANDPATGKARRAAAALEGPQEVALRRLLDRLERGLEEGRDGARLADEARASLLLLLDEPRPRAEGSDPRALAREILARPEFEGIDASEIGPEDAEPGWLERLFRWLFGRERDPAPEPEQRRCSLDSPVSVGSGVGPGASRAAAWVLAALASAVVVVLLLRSLRSAVRRQAPPPSPGGQGEAAAPAEELVSALSKEPAGWWSEADELAARGDFRGAVRALYLAVLAALHRSGAIEYDPARSNWDYVRDYRGKPDWQLGFTDLTRRFDFAWYGRVGLSAEGYARARELARPVLEGEAGHA